MNDGVKVSVNKREGSGGKAEKTMIVVRWGCLSVITQGHRETMTQYKMAVTGIYREEKNRRDVKPLSSRTAVYLTKTLSFTLQKHSRLRRSQHSQYDQYLEHFVLT